MQLGGAEKSGGGKGSEDLKNMTTEELLRKLLNQ